MYNLLLKLNFKCLKKNLKTLNFLRKIDAIDLLSEFIIF